MLVSEGRLTPSEYGISLYMCVCDTCHASDIFALETRFNFCFPSGTTFLSKVETTCFPDQSFSGLKMQGGKVWKEVRCSGRELNTRCM